MSKNTLGRTWENLQSRLSPEDTESVYVPDEEFRQLHREVSDKYGPAKGYLQLRIYNPTNHCVLTVLSVSSKSPADP